eukprot:TRINITY_DN18012_c0_g1_i1.p1 TRINITY_DN18012_c0_g1~~TRINITY_DN18012_c0_g1_i1.p1  ORF type:complete len:348 (+),score=92.31 TRINITY_DN18012_c0_g1_i1:44-1045(+)
MADGEPDPAEQLRLAQEAKERGAELYKQQRFTEARDAWREALFHLPSGEDKVALGRLEVSLHLNLSQVYLQLKSDKDYVDAITHATEALKLEGESSKALFRRGCALAALGQRQAAAGDLQRAARLEPRNAEIRKKYEELKRQASEEEAANELPPPVHRLEELPRCFLDISVGGAESSRMVFALYTDTVAKTAENFRQLCTGEHSGLTSRGKKFSYKGSVLHRIVPGLIVQGGDFENANGTGGESIYGRRFQDEAFRDKHTRRGLLGMANDGPNTNGSNFFVLLQPAEHLDRKHVIFGELVEGFDLLDKLEQQSLDDEGRPLSDCVVVDCGECK